MNKPGVHTLMNFMQKKYNKRNEIQKRIYYIMQLIKKSMVLEVKTVTNFGGKSIVGWDFWRSDLGTE